MQWELFFYAYTRHNLGASEDNHLHMSEFTSKRMGWLALTVGVLGGLAVISLVLFFIGLFQNIDSLSFMGALNDTLNAITGILGAVLALRLHPALSKLLKPSLSLAILMCAWAGAICITIGSWLIQSGGADVELSSYYFFFGNGLIGSWLWVLNRTIRRESIWPRNLTILGSIASLFMMLGLPALVGILLGLDGNEYSPLIMVSGISFVGTGILYPIWSLWLARWILFSELQEKLG